MCVPYWPTSVYRSARKPSCSIVYGRPVAGSVAGANVAGPNPGQMVVVGLNECVRSTNGLEERMPQASASEWVSAPGWPDRGDAQPSSTNASAVLKREVAIGTFVFVTECD